MTLPSARAPGISSCIRLMQRTTVDLPDPDGPINAVTCPRATGKLKSRTLCWLPYQALRPRIVIPFACEGAFPFAPAATAPSRVSPSTAGPTGDGVDELSVDSGISVTV